MNGQAGKIEHPKSGLSAKAFAYRFGVGDRLNRRAFVTLHGDGRPCLWRSG
jgi:hypothetical protein